MHQRLEPSDLDAIAIPGTRGHSFLQVVNYEFIFSWSSFCLK